MKLWEVINISMLFLRMNAGGGQDLSLKLKMQVNLCVAEGSLTLSPFFLITSGSNMPRVFLKL